LDKAWTTAASVATTARRKSGRSSIGKVISNSFAQSGGNAYGSEGKWLAGESESWIDGLSD
jgi:hypothetical protein